MRKIVVNTRALSSPVSGVQRYTLELLPHIKDRVEAISPDKPLHGMKGHAWEQLVLPFLIDKHFLWSPSNTGPVAIQEQVVTIHDMGTFDSAEGLNRWFATWYRWLIPKLVHRVLRVITVSNFSKERILDITRIADKKIVVIYNGVNHNFFCHKSKEEIERTIRDLSIPSPHYILGAATIEHRKNFQRLIKAWGILQEQLSSDIWLVLAGDKEKGLVFRDVFFEKLPPRIYFTGHVKDGILPLLYSGASAFCFPSLYEGFGFPPLEAMACGCPVIVSNVASLPEVCGDAAYYVDPYSVESMAEGIYTVLTNESLRQSMIQKGLERTKLFSWERSAMEHLRAFEEVLNN